MSFKLQIRVKFKLALVCKISIFAALIDGCFCGRVVCTTGLESEGQIGGHCTQLVSARARGEHPLGECSWSAYGACLHANPDIVCNYVTALRSAATKNDPLWTDFRNRVGGSRRPNRHCRNRITGGCSIY